MNKVRPFKHLFNFEINMQKTEVKPFYSHFALLVCTLIDSTATPGVISSASACLLSSADVSETVVIHMS